MDMEAELGLLDLSGIEKDVLYAISETLQGDPPVVQSEALRSHVFVAAMPQATFHRALRNLLEKGYVSHAPNTKAGRYVLGSIGR